MDSDVLVAAFHFISTAARAFPGEVFEAFGGEKGYDTFEHQAERTRDDEFDIVGCFQDDGDLVDAESAEDFKKCCGFSVIGNTFSEVSLITLAERQVKFIDAVQYQLAGIMQDASLGVLREVGQCLLLEHPDGEIIVSGDNFDLVIAVKAEGLAFDGTDDVRDFFRQSFFNLFEYGRWYVSWCIFFRVEGDLDHFVKPGKWIFFII